MLFMSSNRMSAIPFMTEMFIQDRIQSLKTNQNDKNAFQICHLIDFIFQSRK